MNNDKALEFRLENLSCAHCAAKLERRIASLPGVRAAKLNFPAARLTVYGNVGRETVIDEAKRDGVTAIPAGEDNGSEQPLPSFWAKYRRAVISILTGVLLIAGWYLDYGLAAQTGAGAMYLACIIIGGYPVGRKAFSSLRGRRLDMNVLMSVAVIGAVFIGEWSEGATVAFLFSVSDMLETYTTEKTRGSIRRLMQLAPTSATVIRNSQEVKLPVSQIMAGDILLIRPGEKIALDGIVTAGSSAVNQSAITGESLPVDRRPGDEVFAGTINGEGSLQVKVTRTVKDTTLSKIIYLVEEAQAQRAPYQTLADRFAAVYTPTVMALAALLITIPPLLLAKPWEPWLYRGLALLMVACPCALVISTPVAIVSAIGGGARHGVLIKGGMHLETLGQLKALAFDKTGTLTVGTPEVTQILTLPVFQPDKLLTLVAAVEYHSEHPLAQAIVKRAMSLTLNSGLPPAHDFKSFTGLGAKAVVEGRRVLVGSPRLLEQHGIDTGVWQATLANLQEQGLTVVMVAIDGEATGCLALSDTVRPQAAATLDSLKKLGLHPLVMLTGDHMATAGSVARQIGIPDYQANLLPQDKVLAVQTLRERYGSIGMVGDGINDAPALAAANIGIAMGGAGNDTALETADVVLMTDDLSKLPFAVRLGREARRVIKQNIFFAISIKTLAVLLVFPGWLTLWLAILADMGAGLLVTLNSMRLLALRPKQANPAAVNKNVAGCSMAAGG
ncbi:heavy metal translocating P-type ATPase [Desulforamulus hydrothermalis]|uniref:Cd(2+)-exporting ATPase n=1 Tax=Desulforamulus hydrothermalis Lam5 = DSM 18033 TaxID=1121428 RepID=K8DX28_9FIRM|nr:cation-translocating P-type ATPase [Desulforamulus hydrothermalis]CCO07049.1 putative cadmium-transporting ATPase [Desulforamulus hydrothermalis Lam5 = DSM 18033]SHG96815.1 Cd2+/Zn2+-exporting ATPase [Desulforamulus hydrothermalis Lam5 = DSM 18033]